MKSTGFGCFCMCLLACLLSTVRLAGADTTITQLDVTFGFHHRTADHWANAADGLSTTQPYLTACAGTKNLQNPLNDRTKIVDPNSPPANQQDIDPTNTKVSAGDLKEYWERDRFFIYQISTDDNFVIRGRITCKLYAVGANTPFRTVVIPDDVQNGVVYDALDPQNANVTLVKRIKCVASTLPPAGAHNAGGYLMLTCRAIKVEFKEIAENEPDHKYGWDDYSMIELPSIIDRPVKSVAVGETDRVWADITPDEAYPAVAYRSVVPSIVTVSPPTASASEEIEITGVIENRTTVRAEVNQEVCTQMYCRAYNLLSDDDRPTVALVRVHEEPGKQPPVANDIGYTTRINIDSDACASWLRKVFRQAVMYFDVTELEDMTVNFDIGNDQHLDSSSTTGWTPERTKLKNECLAANQQLANYDYVVFFVGSPQPNTVNGIGLGAFAFMHVSSARIFAHEIGHCLNLDHTMATDWFTDPDNVMTYTRDKWRLRDHQWRTIQQNL